MRVFERAPMLLAAAVLTVGTGAAAIVGLATGAGGHGCTYDRRDATVAYHGRYVPLQGIPMSKAYRSTLNISYDHHC